MTTPEFIDLLQSLRLHLDQPTKLSLDGFIRSLANRDAPTQPIPEAEVLALCSALRELEYKPTVTQVAKVLIGSRSIADPRLRGLPGYRKYRGTFSRKAIRELLLGYKSVIEGPDDKSTPQIKQSVNEPWRAIDFFTTAAFDKLSDEKATELYREVIGLGLRKSSDQLPEFMARARKNLPRAFEPWTREERALLIEAMCYTNDGEKLASIFGRSPAAVRREGQRLIYNSQKKEVA
ncbi:hypothetical protein GGR28_002775 [Lewinella aquimaris]|uniref:Uncharacterized protein n=1 Tax=Neolewinella aquimaris TaxID=1835722 RepID=A0A840E9B1_9BACT|nr:hypothetical protein [Neolewinella aquimaris]MBB4080145.1 hypothetical protein [Neolewinella aquimaris]